MKTVWTRTTIELGILGLCLLAVLPAAGRAEPAPDRPATIDYDNLLKGRYSFRFQGHASQLSDVDHPSPLSAVGSIVFDGKGEITAAKFFLTQNGFTARWGRDTDPVRFVSGTYTVNNTEVGHVDLHFTMDGPFGSELHLNLKWDIALTNGGKAFYMNIHKLSSGDADLYWTASGQAAQE